MNRTPRGNRLHIGIYGRRNAGKSTLINELTGQDIALVSDAPGTTTDPVYKSMELFGVGPVVFIDTAGFDDEGELGRLRVNKTEETLAKVDIAILVLENENMYPDEREWHSKLAEKGVPVIVYRKEAKGTRNHAKNLEELRKAITEAVPEDFVRERVLGSLIEDGGLALLVMPQDIQAPAGRLILPQVQTLRELLDKRCTAVSTTVEGLERTLKLLNREPDLIITDSQCFRQVYDVKPPSSALTSFSILFAAEKGDIDKFVSGASALDDLSAKIQSGEYLKAHILIAEACTHVPKGEDIGTVKIPAALKKFFDGKVEVSNVRGNDFPDTEELQHFDLVIHCGACMFNRRHVLSRIAQSEDAGVPITNYGVVLAKLAGILDKLAI